MLNAEQLREIIENFIAEINNIFKAAVEDSSLITKQGYLELLSHEGMVLEAYKDSKGIWTWGVGVTNNSGHIVYPRYKDNPQSIKKVIDIFKWLVETKYLPDVLEAFEGISLTKEQLAAAVSFHYNTGAIKRAAWVKSFKAGNITQARKEIMNYCKPREIIERREKERNLFFDGVWSNDGKTNLYTRVRKPSYSPVWSSLKRIDISEEF